METQRPRAPLIYNLFPRLVGSMDRWPGHTARAAQMGFDWIYINPIQYPGFSGSLYAVKDYYRLNPLFVPEGAGDPDQLLRQTLARIHDQGLRVMMDLVVNHTAKDSLIAAEHPEWFLHDEDGELVSPSAIDPADARKVTRWGDLAELDHQGSSDQQGLWGYLTRMVQQMLELGFDGFRCDAAYKVPAALWTRLIGAARERLPSALFCAETLGCRLQEVRELSGVGFDYLFNSSKYWNFDAPWALQQHAEFGQIAPSIAFPESHDTPRLMTDSGGLEQVQKQRYAFAAVFSAGLLMPVGFEFGFTRKLDVVQTLPEHWEQTGLDLTPFITEVNRLKRSLPLLGQEGRWEVVTSLDSGTALLRKRSVEGAGGPPPVLVAVNKDWRASQALTLAPGQVPPAATLHRPCPGLPPRILEAPPAELPLDPAEVALVELHSST